MKENEITSAVVIVSWWSNCLALACLERLEPARDPDRPVYVVQVGKPEAQKQGLRRLLPVWVNELPYDEAWPAEHSRVIAHVVAEQLTAARGLWFLDHDLFFTEPPYFWLESFDHWASHKQLVLCTAVPRHGPSLTAPAFWLSAAQWPAGISFDPLPFNTHEAFRRPDCIRWQAGMRLPDKDTLAQAQEFLSRQGKAGHFPLSDAAAADTDLLPPFPEHDHLGGLFLLAGPLLPASYQDWMRHTVSRLRRFFEECPSSWLAAEDPVLLQRLAKFEDDLVQLGKNKISFIMTT